MQQCHTFISLQTLHLASCIPKRDRQAWQHSWAWQILSINVCCYSRVTLQRGLAYFHRLAPSSLRCYVSREVWFFWGCLALYFTVFDRKPRMLVGNTVYYAHEKSPLYGVIVMDIFVQYVRNWPSFVIDSTKLYEWLMMKMTMYSGKSVWSYRILWKVSEQTL